MKNTKDIGLFKIARIQYRQRRSAHGAVNGEGVQHYIDRQLKKVPR
jgi:hypothetical protein